MEPKQVIVVRKDLNMRKGKLAAQVAHASMGVIFTMMKKESKIRVNNEKFMAGDKDIYDYYNEYILKVDVDSPLDLWLDHRAAFTKIIVSVNSKEELYDIQSKVSFLQIPNYLVVDLGKTEFNGMPTETCLAIGPDWAEKIDTITRNLPLL